MANVSPLAPTLTSPDDNGYVVGGEAVVFAWVFNDPGDYQSAMTLRYRVPAGAWVSIQAAQIPSTYTLPGGTLTVGVTYEWQVQTQDAAAALSPWSASRFFTTIAAVPPLTVSRPYAGETLSSTPILVAWTIPAGFTQDAYSITVTASPGIVYYQSGAVESVAARSAVVPLPAGSGPRDISVLYRYHGHWSAQGGTAKVAITNGILAPAAPMVVLAQTEDKPEVVVRITNPGGTGRVNKCLNPSFEVDIAGWGGQPIVRDTAQAVWGSASGRFDTVVAGDHFSRGTTGSPGEVRTVSCYVRGTGSVKMTLVSLGEIVVGSSEVVALTGAWARISVTGVLGAEGIGAYRVYQMSTGVNSLWADAFLAEMGDQVRPYFDGDTPADGTFVYSWSAFPHASVSTASTGMTDTMTNDVTRDGVRVATGLPPNAVFVDSKVGAGTVDYRAVAYAASGGTATSF